MIWELQVFWPFLFWSLRLPQVFYNQGLSSLRRCVSYVRAEYQTCTSAYLFDTLVTGMDLSVNGVQFTKSDFLSSFDYENVDYNLQLKILKPQISSSLVRYKLILDRCKGWKGWKE